MILEEEEEEKELHPRTEELINLIFDTKMIAKEVKEIGYDTAKMPLGALKKDSIKKAYAVLDRISKELKRLQDNDNKKNNQYKAKTYSSAVIIE